MTPSVGRQNWQAECRPRHGRDLDGRCESGSCGPVVVCPRCRRDPKYHHIDLPCRDTLTQCTIDADFFAEKRKEMGAVTAFLARVGGVSEHETKLMLEHAPEVVIPQSSATDSSVIVAKMFDRYGVSHLQTTRFD